MDGADLSIHGSFWPLIMDGAWMVIWNNSGSHIAWIVRELHCNNIDTHSFIMGPLKINMDI
mgnify:FL=1